MSETGAQTDTENHTARRRRLPNLGYVGEADMVLIPLPLPGRGLAGEVRLPAAMTELEWATLEAILSAYRGAIVREGGQ
jgi:hypothetical protein